MYLTKPEAYDVMWKRLENYYEDVGASVQAALEDLHKLKAVSEDDCNGLAELIDEIESAYSQLEKLNQLNILTMRDVDMISELSITRKDISITRQQNAKSSSNFQSVARTENMNSLSILTAVLNASEITEGKIVQRKSRARAEAVNIISFFVSAKILKKRLRKKKG